MEYLQSQKLAIRLNKTKGQMAFIDKLMSCVDVTLKPFSQGWLAPFGNEIRDNDDCDNQSK